MAWNEPGGNNKDRDPWGGSNRPPEPPDLDEALRKLQKKITRIMGGGKGNGNGTSETDGKGGLFGLGFIFIILAVLWVASGIFIVSPAEQAVVSRFGRYISTEEPGPHWIPRIIDNYHIINVQKVSTFSYTALMLTKDENIVSVKMAIQYRINSPSDYLFNVLHPNESLKQASASALRQVIGHTTLDEVLTVGREQVRRNTNLQINHIMDLYKAGITITDVNMQPAKAPEEVKEAFDDAIKAQEDEQRFINQAQAYSRGVIPIAEGGAKRILREADAYKQQIILAAKGDVSRFLALLPEYKHAPKVTRERLYLDTMESVLSSTTKIFFDTKGSNNLTLLPLEKLLSENKASSLLPTSTQSSSSSASNHQASNRYQLSSNRRGRDSYQGRERRQ